MNEVGSLIVGWLRAYGIKQKTLADDLRWSPSYLSQLCQGRKHCSPEHAREIAAALVLSPDQSAQLQRAAARQMGYQV